MLPVFEWSDFKRSETNMKKSVHDIINTMCILLSLEAIYIGKHGVEKWNIFQVILMYTLYIYHAKK